MDIEEHIQTSELGIWELFNLSWKIFRNHWNIFIAISFICTVPIYSLLHLFIYSLAKNINFESPINLIMLNTFVPALILIFLYFISILITISFTFLVIENVLKHQRKSCVVALKFGVSRLPPLVRTSLPSCGILVLITAVSLATHQLFPDPLPSLLVIPIILSVYLLSRYGFCIASSSIRTHCYPSSLRLSNMLYSNFDRNNHLIFFAFIQFYAIITISSIIYSFIIPQIYQIKMIFNIINQILNSFILVFYGLRFFNLEYLYHSSGINLINNTNSSYPLK